MNFSENFSGPRLAATINAVGPAQACQTTQQHATRLRHRRRRRHRERLSVCIAVEHIRTEVGPRRHVTAVVREVEVVTLRLGDGHAGITYAQGRVRARVQIREGEGRAFRSPLDGERAK